MTRQEKKEDVMAFAEAGSRTPLSPLGMGGSFLLTGGSIVALLFIAPHVGRPPETDYTSTRVINLPDPKPRDDPKVEKTDPRPPDVTIVDGPPVAHAQPPAPMKPFHPVAREATPILPPCCAVPLPPKVEPDLAPLVTEQPLPPHDVVETPVTADPRYAAALQPNYPAAMRRAGKEGRVVVRIRVSPQGQVLQVEPVSSPDPAFFAETQRHALKKWRFKPATQDGRPVESWYVVSILFRLENE
jgi:protein TonB